MHETATTTSGTDTGTSAPSVRVVDDVAEVVTAFKVQFDALAEQTASVVRGRRRPVHLALVCLFSEGHLLIEDVPGVGKTSLAKAIAHSVGGTWRRGRFTPQLRPARRH